MSPKKLTALAKRKTTRKAAKNARKVLAFKAVEAGKWMTAAKALESYPQIRARDLYQIPIRVALKPATPDQEAHEFETFRGADVEALADASARAAEQSECPMCLGEDLDDALLLACGHRIHSTCYEQYTSDRELSESKMRHCSDYQPTRARCLVCQSHTSLMGFDALDAKQLQIELEHRGLAPTGDRASKIACLRADLASRLSKF